MTKTAQPVSGIRREEEIEREPAKAEGAGFADFLSEAAHDLRSPLGVVLHTLRQIEADLGPQLRDDHQVLLKLGTRGARRIQNLADRIALLSEVESGNLAVSMQLVDVVQVVETVRATTASIEPRSEIRVTFEPPPHPVKMQADPRLLGAALLEILRNAVLHARREVRISIERSDGRITVSIEDDGDGMTDAARATIFRRFVPKTRRGGTGVGLSIAHDLIAAHGGTLSMSQSRLPPTKAERIGARFVCAFPVDSGSSSEGRPTDL
jgi:signal transduction histidine kinase